MKKLIGSFLILGLIWNAHARVDPLAEGLKQFKKGAYLQAIEVLEGLRTSTVKVRGTKHYLMALSLNRLQRFDKALNHFELAIKNNNPSNDLYYEYGQALYANNELEKARKAFHKSYVLKYKTSTCLYYMGHISQLLEQHKSAKTAYERLVKEENENKNLMQVGRFQLGEALVAMAEEQATEDEEEATRLVSRYAIPWFKKAIKVDEKSSVADDIRKRLVEIERRYGLDPDLMKNGRILPKRRWSLSFTQDMKYDNNITLATDLPSIQATQKDSFILNSEFQGSLKKQWKGLYTITPQVRITNKRHTNRESEEVYQNDTFTFITYLKNTREHKAWGSPASFIFDVDHTYTARDHFKIKDKKKYATAWTFTLGEKFKYFRYGDTSIKFKYKDYVAYDLDLNNKTKTLQFDQILATSAQNLFILFVSLDFIDVYNDTDTSTNSYLFRFDWLKPEFWPGYLLNFAMSYSLLDTKAQKLTRGTEKTYNPEIKLTKKVGKHSDLTLSYSYTKNTSLDKDTYQYTKHVSGLEFKVRF